MWNKFTIFVLFLSTTTPEWSPIELLGVYLTNKLVKYPPTKIGDEMRSRGCSVVAVAYTAKQIPDDTEHKLVKMLQSLLQRFTHGT